MLKYIYSNRSIQSDDLADLNAIHPNGFVNLNAVLGT